MSKTNIIPTTFGIYGTCVSVDVFSYNHSEIKNLSDKTAMRDCTILGLDTPRPKYALNDAIKHHSSLHTMWLNTIYDGKVFQFMRDNVGEYLIIDLVDERYSSFKYGETVFLEHFFSESNFFELIDKDNCDFGDSNEFGWGVEIRFGGEEIEQKVKYFSDQILQIYDAEKIIINRFYLAHQYIRNGEIYNFDDEKNTAMLYKSDKFFPLLYAYLKKYLPGCKVIKFDKEYLADSNNPRGLSPVHNTLDYYDDTYRKLQDLVEADYTAQRSIPLSKLEYSNINDSIEKFKALGCNSDYLTKIFSRINYYISLEGKNVLWINGPNISEKFIRNLKIHKFARLVYSLQEGKKIEYFNKYDMALNLSDDIVSPKLNFTEHNFAYYWGKLTELTEKFTDLFDVIYIDDMEEIDNLDICLDNIYKCLRRGGVFFGKTGRTWSSSCGSKWYIDSKCNYLNSVRIPQYTHLLMNFQEADSFLQKEDISLSPEEILRGIPGLNHLFYEDYEYLVKNSLFRKKRIAPLFREEINSETLNDLKTKYPGYQSFEYKSLFIFCEK